MRSNRTTTAVAAAILLASIAAGYAGAGCASSTSAPAITVHPTDPPCGTYKGHQLFLGPRMGCYYIDPKGGKKYVDHDFCVCEEKQEREEER